MSQRNPDSTDAQSSTRTAVLPGENIRTLPDNWHEAVETSDNRRYLKIRDRDKYVLVTRCEDDEGDYWHVLEVGEPEITGGEGQYPTKKQFGDLIVPYRNDRDDLDHDAVHDKGMSAYRILMDYWNEFVGIVLDSAKRHMKAEFERAYLETDGYLSEDDVQNLDVDFPIHHDHAVHKFVDNHENLSVTQSKYLIDGFDALGISDVMPYDGMNVEFREIPVSQLEHFYAQDALYEVGCTSPETTDYVRVEGHSEAQREWGKTRDVSQSAVSQNVTAAKQKMDCTVSSDE